MWGHLAAAGTRLGATMTRTFRRWTARIVGGVIALSGVGLAGCKHELFQQPADSPQLRRPNIPAELETRPHDPIYPGSAQIGQDPATVVDLKRTPRQISLKEAVAIAIEQGNTGSPGGQGQDNTVAFGVNGRQQASDTIKAFVLDPAIAQAEVERSLSKFDARWITSMSWAKQDQATLNLQQSFSNGDSAAFSTTLAKPLPTGGVAGITTSVNYLKLSDPPASSTGFVTLSTSYTPRVQFVFEQPLLQGFGVEANQLLNGHPGSLLIQGFQSTGQGTESILVTRVRVDQAREQFNSQLNLSLLNVEVAYWTLYAAYYNLYAQEEGLKAAYSALNFNRPRVDKGIEEPQLLPQLERQYYTFYSQVVDARGTVLEADRAFRGLLGLRSDDGTIFVPADDPAKAPLKYDFKTAYSEGLEHRPEVLLARQDLKIQQLNLRQQRILRMPDLRFFSNYDVNALGGDLFGGTGALHNLGQNQFNSYNYGIRLNVPLGFRDANALVRESQLNLWRSWYTLSDAERKVFEVLTQSTRQMDQAYQQITLRRLTREAAQRQVDLINQRIVAGSFSGGAQYLQLTQAQQDLANATSLEFRAVADYNSAMARVEYAKGTIQRYNNISVADGALPAFVQKKAADHFRERQAGLKLREHPADPSTGNIGGFQFAPLAQFNPDGLPGGVAAQPPAGGAVPAGAIPTVPAPAAALPASGSVKSYDVWQKTADPTTGASVPATLPAAVKPVSVNTDVPAPTFTQQGTLTLPPARPTGGK